jgi:sRNA-binding protein
MYCHRDDRDECIAYLAERFPKCFFEDSAQRLPLKKDIINDLARASVLDGNKLAQTLDWYTSHYAYEYALVAGAPRINLDGNKAGSVTPLDQQEALKRIKTRKSEMKARQAAANAMPVVVAKPPRMNGASIVSKIPAPPTRDDPVAELRDAVNIAGSILNDKQYAPLRAALAATALKAVIDRAEQIAATLKD